MYFRFFKRDFKQDFTKEGTKASRPELSLIFLLRETFNSLNPPKSLLVSAALRKELTEMKENLGAYRSRLAYDIDISKIACIVSIKDDRNNLIHIPSLGASHSLSVAESEMSSNGYQSLSLHISQYLRSDIYHHNDNFTTARVSIDDELRNHQAETFMTLVYEIQESSVLSLELASPALHALQMLLQSDWQPGNSFPSQFLEALVQILCQFEDQRRTIGNSASSNGSISFSCSNIAEDLIKTIFNKYPTNNNIILNILFNKLRGSKLHPKNSVLMSILSEGLEWYMRSSLASIIANIVQRTNLFAQKELLGANKAKADTKWRCSLNLGDSVEALLDGDNSILWKKACIVRINLQTDTFTLEYSERPFISMQQVNDTDPSSQLLQLSRSSPHIRPVSSNENIRARHDEIFTATGQNEINNLDPSLIPSHLDMKAPRYSVGNCHKQITDLIFNTIKPMMPQEPESASKNESIQKSEINDQPLKCINGHKMDMTFFGFLHRLRARIDPQPILCGVCKLACIHSKTLHCDQCLRWNSECKQCKDEDETDLKAWDCDECNYHICFSCHSGTPTASISKLNDQNQSVLSISKTSQLQNEHSHELQDISTFFPVNTNPRSEDTINDRIESEQQLEKNYELADLIEATIQLDKARKAKFMNTEGMFPYPFNQSFCTYFNI
jgi:hypothetical protein